MNTDKTMEMLKGLAKNPDSTGAFATILTDELDKHAKGTASLTNAWSEQIPKVCPNVVVLGAALQFALNAMYTIEDDELPSEVLVMAVAEVLVTSFLDKENRAKRAAYKG